MIQFILLRLGCDFKIYEGINRFTPFSAGAFDSNTGDIFTRVYRDGGGGFTKQAGQTVIDSDNYDDNSGGVVPITANQYSVHFIYLHPDDEHVFCGLRICSLPELLWLTMQI